MPDGSTSNISRCFKGDYEFYGVKSHACHISMERCYRLHLRLVVDTNFGNFK